MVQMQEASVRPGLALIAGLLVGATSIATVGCSQRLSAPIVRESGPGPSRGGSLRMASFVHLRSLDPAVAFDEVSAPITRLVFGTLFRVTDNGVIAGDLVKEFHWEQNGRRLVAELHHGVRMHDGEELVAEDIRRSMERMLHPKTPCPAPSFYDHLEGYGDFRQGRTRHLDGIRVTGRYSFAFVLSAPDASFLPALTLSLCSPVCKSGGKRYAPSFERAPCGAGPYEVQAPYSRDKLVLRRFGNYFRGKRTYLERIVWLFGVRTTSQRFRFERGDIDLVHELSASDSVAFRRDPRWKSLGGWNAPRSTRGIFMNTELEPFNDVRVRRAVAFAIDRAEIASLRAGHLVESSGVIPRGVVGFDPEFKGQHHDAHRALQLMKDAGYPYNPQTGRGGYPHAIDYVVTANSFDQRVAEVFQQQLGRIGIKIHIKPLSWAAYLAVSGRRRTVAMGADGWSADFDDPSDFLDPLFATSAIQPEDSQNRAFFSSPQLDRLLKEGRASVVPEQRKLVYRKAQEIVRDQAPWATVYGYRYYDVWQPYVHGYSIHPHQFLEVQGVWVDQEQRRAQHARGSRPPGSISSLVLGLISGRRRR